MPFRSSFLEYLLSQETLNSISWEYVLWGGTCLVAIAIPYMTYKYLFPTLNYWERRGIPCYNPGLWAYLSDTARPLHEHEMRLYQTYGPVYGRYDGRIPVLTVGDPDIFDRVFNQDFNSFADRRNIQFGDPVMDNILSTLNGHDWKRVRKALSETLTYAQIKRIPGLISCAYRTLSIVKRLSDETKPVDVERLFGSYIIDVIATCAFGTRLESLEAEDNEFVRQARGLFQEGNPMSSILAQYFPTIMRLLRISVFNQKAVNFFRDFALRNIEMRTADLDTTKEDFLSCLLQRNPRSYFQREHADSQITQNEIVAQCVMFFMAGYETTLSLMQYLLYTLAYNDSIQEKIYEEIKHHAEAGSIKNRNVFDVLKKLDYMECVINESLRFCNPCIRMERLVTTDYFVKKLGIELSKNMLISIPFYCIHKDPNNFPQPETFNPDRFKRRSEHKKVFLGFGQGNRSCPGNTFAMAETKLVLMLLIQRFQIFPSERTVQPLRYRVRQKTTLVPETVWVNVRERVGWEQMPGWDMNDPGYAEICCTPPASDNELDDQPPPACPAASGGSGAGPASSDSATSDPAAGPSEQ